MLNQVFVFGYFHADLHPANIFVLDGDSIGYIDFGIVGQLPNRIRESLTRYSWLLFRGEIEPAVRELMRWLAPGPATDIDDASRQLIRLHQAFLYDATADRTRVTRAAPGPMAENRANPYSKLAVDILETIRVQKLTMSPSIVGYLKMLVTLGALRHQLAVDYDLPDNVRRFVRRLARQQGLSLARPAARRRPAVRGAGRVQARVRLPGVRGGQEPAIIEATSALFGFRNRMQNAKRTLIRLGVAILAVGAVLYVVLAFPDDTRRVMPREGPYPWVHLGLLILLLVLIAALINYVRGLGQDD